MDFTTTFLLTSLLCLLSLVNGSGIEVKVEKPPRRPTTTTTTTTQAPAETTTNEGPNCRRHFTHNVNECMAEFQVLIDIYKSVNPQAQMSMAPRICHEYEKTLLCLHMALNNCRRTSRHLHELQTKLTDIADYMIYVCYIAQGNPMTTKSTQPPVNYKTAPRTTPTPAPTTTTTTTTTTTPTPTTTKSTRSSLVTTTLKLTTKIEGLLKSTTQNPRDKERENNKILPEKRPSFAPKSQADCSKPENFAKPECTETSGSSSTVRTVSVCWWAVLLLTYVLYH